MNTPAFIRLFVFLLLFTLSVFPQTADELSCREKVQKYFDYFQQKDLDKLKTLWKSDSPYLKGFQDQSKQLFAALPNISIRNIEFVKSISENEILKLRYKYNFNQFEINMTFQ
ncbi:MAG: hypothetical protein MUF43_09140, partial [Flavobacterium sp.]|nr:hypothetical protein [Flavobacterium sp.]